MNYNDKIFWAFVFGTASTAIGWGLNQFGQWMSVRSNIELHDDRRAY